MSDVEFDLRTSGGSSIGGEDRPDYEGPVSAIFVSVGTAVENEVTEQRPRKRAGSFSLKRSSGGFSSKAKESYVELIDGSLFFYSNSKSDSIKHTIAITGANIFPFDEDNGEVWGLGQSGSDSAAEKKNRRKIIGLTGLKKRLSTSVDSTSKISTSNNLLSPSTNRMRSGSLHSSADSVGGGGDPLRHFWLVLENTEEQVRLGVHSSEERKRWADAIKANTDKPVGKPRSRSRCDSKSLLFRAEKYTAEKLAMTSVGKKAIARASPDLVLVLDNIREFVQVYDCKEKALRLEKQIMKLLVKVITLRSGGILTTEAFMSARVPMLRVWNSFMDCGCSFSKDLDQLRRHFLEFAEAMRVLLTPHLSEKNIAVLSEAMATFSDKDLLEAMFDKSKQETYELTHNTMEVLGLMWTRDVSKDHRDLILADHLKAILLHSDSSAD